MVEILCLPKTKTSNSIRGNHLRLMPSRHASSHAHTYTHAHTGSSFPPLEIGAFPSFPVLLATYRVLLPTSSSSSSASVGVALLSHKRVAFFFSVAASSHTIAGPSTTAPATDTHRALPELASEGFGFNSLVAAGFHTKQHHWHGPGGPLFTTRTQQHQQLHFHGHKTRTDTDPHAHARTGERRFWSRVERTGQWHTPRVVRDGTAGRDGFRTDFRTLPDGKLRARSLFCFPTAAAAAAVLLKHPREIRTHGQCMHSHTNTNTHTQGRERQQRNQFQAAQL